MSFLLPYAFNCITRMNMIQLVFILLLSQIPSIVSTLHQNHSIDFTRDHSIDLIGNHSIAPACLPTINMPVTTRSMVKHDRGQPSFKHPIDLQMTSSVLETDNPLLPVPELEDHCSSSSSSLADSSTSLLDDEGFEISMNAIPT
jgi:hypothetical protein